MDRASIDAIDPLAKRQVKQYIDKITAKLDLEQQVKKSIINRSQSCIDRVEPFSFKEGHLEALQDALSSTMDTTYYPCIQRVYPYKRYISKAEKVGAIDKMLADYLLLPAEKT